MSDVLAALAGGAVGSAGSLLGNLAMNRIENRQYEEHQKDNFQYSQLSQLRGATNTRTALLNAGVSPAVMAGGQFSPAQMLQAPLQNKSVNVDPMAGAVASHQLELLSSEARLKSAEAEQEEIRVNRMKDEDRTYNVAMRDQFNAIADRLDADGSKHAAEVFRQQASAVSSFSKGNFDAWSESIRMINNFTDSAAREYDSRFKAAVSRSQLQNQNIIDAASLLPAATYDKITSEIGDLSASQILKAATVVEKSSSVAKMTAELNEISARVTQLLSDSALKDVQSGATYHSDFAGMMKNGDYGQAAASLISGAISSFATGAGFALGSKLAGGAGAPPKGSLREKNRPEILKKTDTKASNPSPVSIGPNGAPQTSTHVLVNGKWQRKKPDLQNKSSAFPQAD